MTKNELAWAVKTMKLARELRPNADVHLLLRDYAPLDADLSGSDMIAIVNAANLPSVGGNSHG